MDYSQSIMYMIAVCFIFLLVISFSKQLKTLFGFALQGCFGLLGVYILNFVAAPMGLAVGLNFLTWVIGGLLGIPGLLLLYGVSAIL